LAKAQRDRPIGYLVRHAPAEDVRNLQQLSGHLQAGLFITKFRKIFARDEMNDDLLMVPARYQDAVDDSEYEELLPIAALSGPAVTARRLRHPRLAVRRSSWRDFLRKRWKPRGISAF